MTYHHSPNDPFRRLEALVRSQLEQEDPWLSPEVGASNEFGGAIDVAAILQRATGDAKIREHLFRVLVGRAAVDELAALAALSLLAPQLEALTRRRHYGGIGYDEAAAELLSLAWEELLTVARRSTIARDAWLSHIVVARVRRRVRQQVRSGRHRRERLVTLDGQLDLPARWGDPSELLVGLLFEGARRGVISERQRRLIKATRLRGVSLEAYAAKEHRNVDAVRRDRSRAERALRTTARDYERGIQ